MNLKLNAMQSRAPAALDEAAIIQLSANLEQSQRDGLLRGGSSPRVTALPRWAIKVIQLSLFIGFETASVRIIEEE